MDDVKSIIISYLSKNDFLKIINIISDKNINYFINLNHQSVSSMDICNLQVEHTDIFIKVFENEIMNMTYKIFEKLIAISQKRNKNNIFKFLINYLSKKSKNIPFVKDTHGWNAIKYNILHISLIYACINKNWEHINLIVSVNKAKKVMKNTINYIENIKNIGDIFNISNVDEEHYKIIEKLSDSGGTFSYTFISKLLMTNDKKQIEFIKYLDKLCPEILCNDKMLVSKLASEGYFESIKIMCSKKNVRIGEHTFTNACWNGHTEIIKYLWKNCNERIGVVGEKALYFAYIQNHYEIVKFIMEDIKIVIDKSKKNIKRYVSHDGIKPNIREYFISKIKL